MNNNPLGDYLDELLTPTQSAVADWDSMLAEAVEPFQNTPDQAAEQVAEDATQADFSDTTVSDAVMAITTIEAGKEPLLAIKPECLNAHERYAELLNNLHLARQLPHSRLRDYVLAACQKTLTEGQSEYDHRQVLVPASATSTTQVAVYD